MEIDTDPAGARVIVAGKDRGVTSTTISSPCNQAIDITLKRDGYEVIKENIMMKGRMERMYKTLKKIPMGTLELRLSRNAKIFIEGNLITEVKANQKFEYSLRAGQKYNLRFVNDILNIDITKEFVIEEDAVLRKVIQLDEGLPKKKTRRRPSSEGD